MKNLSVIGIGRLGLCLALVLERKGYNVLGCDINKDYVESLNEKTFKTYERDVENFLLKSKNFKATTNLKEAIGHTDMIFVVVRTESEPDGRYDHSQVESVVGSLIVMGRQEQQKHLVIACNVSPGYTDTVNDRLKNLNWTVSFNPETVRQGTILQDYMNPDCVYVGCDNEITMRKLEEVHEAVSGLNVRIHFMDRISAELTKVSLNCYLTTKISFANMVGDLALKIGADPEKVLHAVGSDTRIGAAYFKHGYGFGGPCFPRDNRAFVRCAKDNFMAYDLCEAADEINNKHLDFQVKSFIENNDIRDTVEIGSVTFKKGTDSLEESQQLKFALKLADYGYKVKVSETSRVIEKLKKEFGDLFIYEETNNNN